MAISLTNSTPYTENFNSLANSGTTGTTLPANWVIAESGANANATYTVGSGSGTTGDSYSFGGTGGTDRALGGLRSGNLNPTFGTSFTNNTGSAITALDIAYTGERWRVGTLNRTDRLDFQYSTDATSLTTGTWTDVDTLDFTSTAATTTGSTDGNATANRTNTSGSISSLSLANGSTFWIRWNDFDASGADDGLAVDDFSLTPVLATTPTSTLPILTIAAFDPNAAEAGQDPGTVRVTSSTVATSPINVNFTTASGAGQATFGTDFASIALAAQIPTGSSFVDITITPIDDTLVEGNETFTVNLLGNPLSYTLGSTTSATVTIADNDVPLEPVTRIHAIQGSGATATAGTFTIEGIVVGDFQGTGQLGGFYLQEEDTDADGNALTSEGIFVNSLAAVNFGDRVRVTGTVVENATTPSFGQAIITPTNASDIVVVASGQQALVTATVVDLPTTTLGDLERYEGTLVTIPATLTVTEVFNLGRFGEVSLSANGRLSNPTNVIDPNDSVASGTTSTGNSNVAAVTALQNLNNRSRIILDDGRSDANLADVPYIDTTDSNPLNDTLRIGSTTTGLTGVVGFGFNNYRLQPTATPTFNYDLRPVAPPEVGGSLKVSSFNVLNYFNGDGLGGGFPTSRGADTAIEFGRQRAKIITAITELNADVVGLIEVENDGDGANSAIADLVNGLNTAIGSPTYAFVPLANTTGTPGTDEIKVAFIYKPSAVTPDGNAVYFNDPAFTSLGRPPLAQTFTSVANGEKFTPIINHFKSKSATNATGLDLDQGDGQGAFNDTRKTQATALLNFVTQVQATSGDSDIIILGDLNAYSQEDPIDILRAGGFTQLSPDTQSFVFDGQGGSLDYALVSSSLSTQVTGAGEYNINSVEPIVLDFNDGELTTSEGAAEDRNDTSLYQSSQFRSSDHDPILVGLSLSIPVVIESAFSSQLVTVNNNYFAYDPLPNRFTNIKYAGSNVGTGSYSGWSVIGAETIGGEVRAMWKSTGGLFWYSTNTDNGGIVNNVIPFEVTFQQDFNGDGVIGAVVSTVESAGSTTLSVNNAGRYSVNNGGAFNAELLYSNLPVGPNDFSGWSVIGAEIINNEVLAMWKSSGGAFWLTTNASNGSIVSDIGSYESIFQQDFDINTSINTGGLISQIGSASADSLGGNTTNELLIGGAGVDTFVLKPTNNGLDVIVDFAANERLDVIGFGLSSFDNSNILVGSGVTTATGLNQFILNTDDGALYFDADGASGNPASKLANLLGVSNLTSSNFIAISPGS
jgi:uncharacterized protein